MAVDVVDDVVGRLAVGWLVTRMCCGVTDRFVARLRLRLGHIDCTRCQFGVSLA